VLVVQQGGQLTPAEAHTPFCVTSELLHLKPPRTLALDPCRIAGSPQSLLLRGAMAKKPVQARFTKTEQHKLSEVSVGGDSGWRSLDNSRVEEIVALIEAAGLGVQRRMGGTAEVGHMFIPDGISSKCFEVPGPSCTHRLYTGMHGEHVCRSTLPIGL